MENGSGGVARVHTIRTMRRRLTTDYNAESKNQNTLISATWLGSHAGNKTFSASAPRARYRETSTFGDTCGTVYVQIRSLFIRPPFYNHPRRFIYLDKPSGNRVSLCEFICAAKWPFNELVGQVDHCPIRIESNACASVCLSTRYNETRVYRTQAFERFPILFR